MPVESRYRVRTAQEAGPMRGVAVVTAAAGTSRPGYRPRRWIGAPAPGGLTLPPALASTTQLYAPRGVWLDAERLIVADTGNHRVLIWNATPTVDHQPADVVLGQRDFLGDGAQASGRGAAAGMRLPTGVIVADGHLVVADAWNHRLLVWEGVPSRSDVAPSWIVGQADGESVEQNGGGECGPLGMWWPFGLAVIDGRCYVADTGNRRVLAWDGLPTPGTPPALVLGQPDAVQRDENRGELGPASFRWPHDVAGTAERVFVADAGNHRLLSWAPHPDGDRPADDVLGQPDFVTGVEFPYRPQTATSLRFPYAVDIAADRRMVVADTANNRVLVFDDVPATSGVAADAVIGHGDFAGNGENRWEQVGADTLCWPYGLCLHDDQLAIADSGNNRVMIWELGS